MKNRCVSLAAFGMLAGASVSANAGLIFDNASNFRNSVPEALAFATNSSPNTFMGGGFDLAAGSTAITGFDLFPVNVSDGAFTGLKLTIFVWDNVNTGPVSTANPAFSDLLASYSLTISGNLAFGFYIPLTGTPEGVDAGINLAAPLAIADTRVGITFNFQGTTDGINYSNINGLTSIISVGTPATVGANVFNGFYRNAAGEANGNFTSSLRSFTGISNQSIALRIYGIPTPGSLALLAPAALLVSRRRRV